MIALAEIRNAAEHPGEEPSAAEAEAARSAWAAIKEWAGHQETDVESL